MTTAQGKARCFYRLSAAPDIETLKVVWQSLGVTYQQDQEVLDHKEALKARFEAET